jgi:hypothetical protein
MIAFTFVGCSEKDLDLSVEKTAADRIKIVNREDFPVQIQDIQYNSDRCKRVTRKTCDDHRAMGDHGLETPEGVALYYNNACIREMNRAAFPKTLQQGEWFIDFAPLNEQESGKVLMEIIKVAIVTDHGTTTRTWK